jgi:hypothetical protein
VTGPDVDITPEMQQVSERFGGTPVLSAHIAFGPFAPGHAYVHDRHCFSRLQAVLAQVRVGSRQLECPVVQPWPVGRAIARCERRQAEHGQDKAKNGSWPQCELVNRHATSSQNGPSLDDLACKHGSIVNRSTIRLSQKLTLSAYRQMEKLVPHPQEAVAFGLLT